MSAMSRFGPSVAKNMLAQQHRQMASAAGTQLDPIQKLFIEKIREFKGANKGLDDRHQKLMGEEMQRLRRVYKVEDESKLNRYDVKFSNETQVSLHDLDSSKQLREKIYSGEHQKSIVTQSQPKSALLESIKYREPDGFHLPLINKPDKTQLFEAKYDDIPPAEIGQSIPDYEIAESKVTPESLQRQLRVVFGEKMPTIDDDKSPQRDTVNFPRQPQMLDTPPTVGHIIPKSWFDFFYPKTGVSGPYLFGGATLTFLLSKEWLVYEHELISGMSLILLFAYAIPKFGPAASAFLRKGVEAETNAWDRWQQGTIDTLGKIKSAFNSELEKGPLIDELYNARRQDVELQLELEYRNRLKTLYDETKRRLNYLVAVADSKRQIHQTNMVNWVISNVHASIGPKQEEEYLNNCIVNLKQLAQKNTNAI